MNKSEIDRVIVFLQMIFDRNWPLTEPNHKTKDKPQTPFCDVRHTPNQNKEKWTVPLFENVESKSSLKLTRPKNTEKSGHF